MKNKPLTILMWIIGAIIVVCGVHILGGTSEGIPLWQAVLGYGFIFGGSRMSNWEILN